MYGLFLFALLMIAAALVGIVAALFTMSDTGQAIAAKLGFADPPEWMN